MVTGAILEAGNPLKVAVAPRSHLLDANGLIAWRLYRML